ncbi:hypothetical protein GF327_04455 [Candidatus Woesearchaeota archaeon]|nr:hypothetical protein [Candidatus Woesearchaeota archaeon]
MSKQITIKSPEKKDSSIMKLYVELATYLKYFGFKIFPMIEINTKKKIYKTILFCFEGENILIEYINSKNELMLKVNFYPLNVSVIYDMILMRINQIARLQKEKVIIES